MGAPRRIGMTLLDAELQALLEISLKILPVEYTVITSGVNNLGVDYVIITTPGEHRNEIYHWSGTAWELIGADDRRVDWEHILNKPTTYAPTAHQHDDLYYGRSAIDTYLAAKAPSVHTHTLEDVTNLVSALEGKAPINHTHDYAPLIHDHDGAYATPAQLSQKSDINHNHTGVYSPVDHTHAELADHELRLSLIESGYSEGHFHDNLEQLAAITALKISTWDTVSDKADISVVTAHTGDTEIHVTLSDKTTWNAKQDALSGNVSTHHHDGRYYTKAEIGTLLSAKADSTTLSGHTGNTTVHVTQTDKDKWNASDITVGSVQPTNSSIWFKTL